MSSPPGPCPERHILVLDTESLVGKCQRQPCGLNFEIWNGTACININGGFCNKVGEERLWTTLTGELKCFCNKGWFRNQDTIWSGAWDLGSCNQLSTQAWCPAGQLLQETENIKDCDCVPNKQCPGFQEDLNSIKEKPLKTDDDVNDYKRLILTRCGNIKDKEEFKVCCNKNRLISSW